VPAAFPPSEAIAVSGVSGMHERLSRALQATGHSTLFPVQAVSWQVLAGGLSARHDLCINAPTGSGKTLAYALPVLQRCLSMPSTSGVQALVVVPTRVLAKQVWRAAQRRESTRRSYIRAFQLPARCRSCAVQVYEAFTMLLEHLPGLNIVLANGSGSVSAELAQLSGGAADSTTQGGQGGAATMLEQVPALRKVYGASNSHCRSADELLHCFLAHAAGGRAAACMPGRPVHVAVVTPGRLVHHLRELGASWLASLQMLVRS
jgi:superfamily II DNA/RNA helicase